LLAADPGAEALSQPQQNLERNLARAELRLESARSSRNPDDSFGPLGAALQWSVLLDDWHENAETSYPARRDSDRRGRMLPGLRYAWNLVKHADVSALVSVASGCAYPIQYPLSYHEVDWKRLAELPPPQIPNRRGATAYRLYLEGQPVRLALSFALAFFSELATGNEDQLRAEARRSMAATTRP
jgi:hypothetical protein